MKQGAVSIARFYYPVPHPGGDGVVVMCTYEDSTRSGVDFDYEQGEPVVFACREGAVAYCRWLNERQTCFPGRLPHLAAQFFQEGVKQMRPLSKNGRRYVVALLADVG